MVIARSETTKQSHGIIKTKKKGPAPASPSFYKSKNLLIEFIPFINNIGAPA